VTKASAQMDYLADLHPSTKTLASLFTGDFQDTASLAHLRDDLRRQKYSYIEATTRHGFKEIGSVNKEWSFASHVASPDQLEKEQRDAKQTNKGLKRDSLAALAALEQQLNEYAELYAHADKLHEQKMNSFRDSGHTPQADLDLCLERTSRQCSQLKTEVDKDQAQVCRLQAALRQERAKKQRLKAQRSRLYEQKIALLREVDEYKSECARLQTQCAQEDARRKVFAQNGFSLMNEDMDSGNVVLSRPAELGISVSEPLCSVAISYDNDNRLAQIQPLVELGLGSDCQISEKQDDPSRLLTLAWNEICELSEHGQRSVRTQRLSAHRGGA